MHNDEKLVFSTVSNQEIFGEDFANFCQNNIIDLSNRPMAILYAPNGVGKTSLANVLNCKPGTLFDVSYHENEYSPYSDEKLFHVIADQNNRNIIEGETEDFILGSNIRAERQLKREIDQEVIDLTNNCKKILNSYGVDKKGAAILGDYDQNVIKSIGTLAKRGGGCEEQLAALIKLNEYTIDNSQSKIDLQSQETQEYIVEINDQSSILSQFMVVEFVDISKNEKIHEVGENTDAIKILHKYAHRSECVVCDAHISPQELMEKKQLNKNDILKQINKKYRGLIEQIVSLPDENDFFGIKKATEQFFATQDIEIIKGCKKRIADFGEQLARAAIKELKALLQDTNLFEKNAKHAKMLEETPELTEEDENYLREIVSRSMGKEIQVKRDENSKNLIIKLDNTEFIGKTREELPLSAGEQNFLSLSFELLKAKNSDASIIVLDDPISSFDSIYKYKIIYSILHSTSNKKAILLTHNLDLVRLIRSQNGACFQMYIFNNGDDKENGFIEVGDNEVELMVDLSKMTDFFRKYARHEVKLLREFLIATVPFMRSFAKIIGNDDVYEETMNLMHGSRENASSVDVAKCYGALFGDKESNIFKTHEVVTTDDIIDIQLAGSTEIINVKKYPLLNKALINAIEYLKIRLLVERKLVEQFCISRRAETTNKIILAAYPRNGGINSTKNRIILMAKKTLLNEFNHYEGNLSIFQPAIDISDQTLKKEKNEIEDFFAGEEWKINDE